MTEVGRSNDEWIADVQRMACQATTGSRYIDFLGSNFAMCSYLIVQLRQCPISRGTQQVLGVLLTPSVNITEFRL
jgi:hypothetical protein